MSASSAKIAAAAKMAAEDSRAKVAAARIAATARDPNDATGRNRMLSSTRRADGIPVLHAEITAPVPQPTARPAKIADNPRMARDIPTPAAAPRAFAAETHIRWPILWTIAVSALLAWGFHAHLERYISPRRGVGYWLGIIGGSLMLLLLLYSARKRLLWLRWMGGIPAWFEFHMVLGVVGPILVLFHSNFSLGATNSNVALFSMLLVAASGVIGRYIYTRLHAQLDGSADSLEQLRSVGERLRSQSRSIDFLPGLLDSFDALEERLIKPPKGAAARFLHLFTGTVRVARARHLVRRATKLAVRRAVRVESPLIARHAQRIAEVARRYAYRRIDAGRRVAEYQMYARLFSFWHVLHIPLFFMLLIAGIAHVIAVNVY